MFIAPLGPIELEDLRWYLEEYAVWPGGYVDQRAKQIEQQLEAWGELLYRESIPSDSARELLTGWSRGKANVSRRFSVQVDRHLPKGTDKER